ncbi:unnamed protein product, partial [Rotaria magnacalcarata]
FIQDECTSNGFIPQMYRLLSISIIELDVYLDGLSKARSSIFLLILPIPTP